MKLKLLIILTITFFVTGQLSAQKYKNTESTVVTKMYQGIEFSSEKTLLENLSEANGFSVYAGILEDHSANLFTENFIGTVFVITDTGFERMTEENDSFDYSEPTYRKFQLQYFTVPGRLDAHSIKKAVLKGGGSARYSTVEGSTLEIKMFGDTLFLYVSEKMKAKITTTDFYHKHGFFHIVDSPVVPPSTKN